MVEFLDLPSEILQIIFDYVPVPSLTQFIDIQPIRNYVLNAAYIDVAIGIVLWRYFKNTPHHAIIGHSSFRCLSECVTFLKSEPTLRPKRIHFENPLEAILFAEKYPEYLRGSKIYLDLTNILRSSHDLQIFCDNVKNFPFPIENLHNLDFGCFDMDEIRHISKEMKTLTLKFDLPIDFEKLSLFSRLKSFSCDQINSNDLILLPRQLKTLLCTLEISRHADKLEFPPTLIDLHLCISESNFYYDQEIDISSLEMLQRLTIIENSRSRRINLNLPSNLKQLCIPKEVEFFNDLQLMCPHLVDLKYDRRYGEDSAWKHTFPQTLKVLGIPYGEIIDDDTMDLDHESMSFLKLPSNVVNLELRGDMTYEHDMFLDFANNKLVQLENLVINQAANVTITGDIPANLSKLSLNCKYISGYDLNQLQSLQKLTDLSIICLKNVEEFSYNLPKSLSKLDIKQCEFIRFIINAPELQELRIVSHSLEIIDETVLILPEKLEILDLSSNDIKQLSLSFPNGLVELDLKYNLLESIDNLPESLKKLNCAANQLGLNSGEFCLFPLGLEHLTLTSNLLTDTWIVDSNLKKYNKLKILNLELNSIEVLDSSFLPDSLITLDLFNNDISYIENDLTNLINLEEIVLDNNPLSGYFEEFEEFDDSDIFFGERIKIVSLQGCGIYEYEMYGLFKELKKMPNFIYLNIDKNLIPDLNKPFKEYDIRLVSMN